MSSQPNILLIWTDQQRNDTLPCFGGYAQAPNLDRLTKESFVFRQAYCTQPVCTPSRGAIMTGLWPHAHGAYTNNVPLAESSQTLAELLGDDYHCAYYGKWHLGDETIAQHGFTEWISIEDLYRKYTDNPEVLNRRSSYYDFLMEAGFPPDKQAADGVMIHGRHFAAALPEPYTKAGFLTRETTRFLKDYDKDKPFYLSVNFLEPHPPPFGPLNEMYDPDAIPLGESFLKMPGEDMAQRIQDRAKQLYEDGYKAFDLKKEWSWRRLVANYHGLVTLVDRCVGKILDTLEEAGLADNTLVIFTSDHGEMNGNHALMQKAFYYEESSRIPLVLRAPWLSREGRIIDGPVSQIDLVPTMLDLVGRPVNDHLHGKSRLPVLKGEETLEDNDVFIEWNDPDPSKNSRSIVSGDGFKLNLYIGENCELFDLNSDPHEMTNLYKSPEHQERIAAMAARLKAWQKTCGDTVELP